MKKQISRNLTKGILERIFSIQESKRIRKTVVWNKNQVIIWNNHLVLHKANNDYDKHKRIIWRILIDQD